MVNVTVKSAKEWLSSLPIEDMRLVNSEFKSYADSTSIILRMGKDEWVMNKYHDKISNQDMTIHKDTRHLQDHEDSKKKSEVQVTEEEVEVKETKDEEINNPQDEAQKKVTMMKLAIALLSAGAIWLVL